VGQVVEAQRQRSGAEPGEQRAMRDWLQRGAVRRRPL
jgi:hypothetical protein